MKQIIKLEKQDIDDAVEAYLREKGYRPISIELRMTHPVQSGDPRESSTGTVRYECEVEVNDKA